MRFAARGRAARAMAFTNAHAPRKTVYSTSRILGKRPLYQIDGPRRRDLGRIVWRMDPPKQGSARCAPAARLCPGAATLSSRADAAGVCGNSPRIIAETAPREGTGKGKVVWEEEDTSFRDTQDRM